MCMDSDITKMKKGLMDVQVYARRSIGKDEKIGELEESIDIGVVMDGHDGESVIPHRFDWS
jgi:hypothetical protein